MAALSASVLRARLWGKGRIRHLQVMVQVAELGSIHKAAAAVRMTQPAVTQQIAELERLLETTLFLRHSKGARLTPAGKQLLPLAKRVLQVVDEMADETAALTAEAEGLVRIAASQGGMSAILSRALPRFHVAAPNVAVHVRQTDPASIGPVVALREVDLAVLRRPQVLPEGWEFEPLVDDRLIVIAGRQHPLAGRKTPVALEHLRAQQWLALPIDSTGREAFDRLFATGVQPALCRITARAPAMVWAMLTSLDVLAIAPATLLEQFLASGILVEVPTEIALPLGPVGVLVPVEGRGAAAERFAAFLREQFVRG
jgi:DNA-binding transcriptional LysR family regulator